MSGSSQRQSHGTSSSHIELVTFSRMLVAGGQSFALLLHELKAGDRAGDHVFLNLHQVGIGDGHAENCVEMRAARHKHDYARPIVLVHAAAKTPLDCGARNRNVLHSSGRKFSMMPRNRWSAASSSLAIVFPAGSWPTSRYVVWSPVPIAVIAPGIRVLALAITSQSGGLYI